MPPLGKVCIKYGVRENPTGVAEVYVGDKVVCHLPASKVTWDLTAGDIGVVTIQLVAHRAEIDTLGGDA